MHFGHMAKPITMVDQKFNFLENSQQKTVISNTAYKVFTSLILFAARVFLIA